MYTVGKQDIVGGVNTKLRPSTKLGETGLPHGLNSPIPQI